MPSLTARLSGQIRCLHITHLRGGHKHIACLNEKMTKFVPFATEMDYACLAPSRSQLFAITIKRVVQLRNNHMAKGQQKSNREAKKPKAEKPKPAAASTFATQVKPKAGGSTGGKK